MDLVFKTGKAVFNYRVAGIWIKNDHVLIHKDVNDTKWALPGGRAEMFEDSRNTLIREFQEELAVKAETGRLLWIVENFFSYRGTEFHEIGLYYEVVGESSLLFQSDAFHGEEGERLIYKWLPIGELDTVELYPAFLRKGLRALPAYTEHLITRQD
ncbi:NUDIX hydrolase [Virgibacillus indicus]|uniref:NUDIX hydrolase n=1 Tax=Virgibacillus indicus TaxID=2024554 RepID=A0A265NCB0_9BACI|nr:NUDIX hydrolase [Virgibacillus indicus]OZU89425.1 NUDIX hydrolase [Virgibacillus indicus]